VVCYSHIIFNAMTKINQQEDLNREKVNQETAKIPWPELQRFFAQGMAIFVTPELDLVEVAHAFSIDQKSRVEKWMQKKQLAKVSDQQALQWFDKNLIVWAVIVKPWILVQEVDS
jgi:hypothetical protein